MTPRQFESLTRTEFEQMVEARSKFLVETETRWREFLAALVANLMNCWLKDPIKASQLLGGEYLVKEAESEKKRAKDQKEQARVKRLLDKQNPR